MASRLVAVAGASGFVGQAVVHALEARGATVRRVIAPRVVLPGPDRDEPARARAERAWLGCPEASRLVEELAAELAGVDCVVNAAGLAQPGAGWGSPELFGANALLPALVAAAARSAGCRAVHVSSASVQGGRSVLDEGAEVAPTSAYSWSKADGEHRFREAFPEGVIYRATSVQGIDRAITCSLVRLTDLPVLPLATPGQPVPLALISTTADAIAHLALQDGVRGIAVHPPEGVHTKNLVEAMGGRARVLPVPVFVGRIVLALLSLLSIGGHIGAVASLRNRVALLLRGVRIEGHTLEASGWRPPRDITGYRALRLPEHLDSAP